MARPKTSDYLKDEDLAWFNLDNYADLRVADVKTWAKAIYTRAMLQRFLENDGRSRIKVKQLFERLKTDPLDTYVSPEGETLGFDVRLKGSHPCDTPSVKMLTVNRARSLSHEFSGIRSNSKKSASAVDELLLSREHHANHFIHLSVDLQKSKGQIIQDFDKLLSAWRIHKARSTQEIANDSATLDKAISRWADNRVIPYFDLSFFATLCRKRIRSKTYIELLQFDRLNGDPQDKLDRLHANIADIISLKTYDRLPY